MFLAQLPYLGLNRRRGLTLQEMLVVVAVFAILATIFIFSSRQVLIKTRHSKVKQDQRLLAIALDYYKGDRSVLPTDEEGLKRLRGAYISELPQDPFGRRPDTDYRYRAFPEGDAGDSFWILLSPGPDGDIDFELFFSDDDDEYDTTSSDGAVSVRPGEGASRAELIALITARQYDPTNGVDSDGDIIDIE